MEKKRLIGNTGFGVMAIILDRNNHALLLNRRDGKGWDTCKGGIRVNETEEKAITREITEECGEIEVELIKKFDFLTEGRTVWYGKEITIVTRPFLFRFVGGRIKLSEEHSEYDWFDLNEAKDLIYFENGKEIIEKIIDDIHDRSS